MKNFIKTKVTMLRMVIIREEGMKNEKFTLATRISLISKDRRGFPVTPLTQLQYHNNISEEV